MTISSTTRKTTANCNGSTHEFPFSFPIISEDDLVVQIKDANGVITTLTMDSDYEVTAVNDDFENGGSVNTITYSSGSKADYAWASGNEIIIYRDTPLTQGTAFRRGREMNPSTESGLDKITMQVQELSEEVARCIKAPIEDSATSYELPDETDRASRHLAFDADGNPIATSGEPAGTPCSAFAATVIDDASADAMLATLLFSVFVRSLVGSTNLAALLTAMGIPAYIQTILDDTNAAGVIATLGLDADIATLSLPASTTISAFGKTLTDDADAATAQETLCLAPWLIDINVLNTPGAQTNWSTLGGAVANCTFGYLQSSGDQNAEISWPVVLSAGTWTIAIMYAKDTTHGIMSVQIDGVEKGTIDCYAGSGSQNNISNITSVAVATPGKKTLTLKMATKNGSSSSYVGTLQLVRLLRTA